MIKEKYNFVSYIKIWDNPFSETTFALNFEDYEIKSHQVNCNYTMEYFQINLN